MTTSTNSLRTNLIAGAVAVAVMVIAFFAFGAGEDDLTTTVEAPTSSVSVADGGTATTSPTIDGTEALDESQAASSTDSVEPSPALFSDLPTITIDELPIEAIETLLLIDAGGPYPYRQDDGTFQNREGLLPDRELGHYREYTVDTPGSPDRGARRIVSGLDGERYYTSDHYDSFQEITS